MIKRRTLEIAIKIKHHLIIVFHFNSRIAKKILMHLHHIHMSRIRMIKIERKVKTRMTTEEMDRMLKKGSSYISNIYTGTRSVIDKLLEHDKMNFLIDGEVNEHPNEIDFEHFKCNYPELTPAWDAFERWQVKYPNYKYLDIRDIVTSERDISIDLIINSIEVLLESGQVCQVYKVLHPIYNVIGNEYSSPLEVPNKVRVRSGEWVDTDETEIIPLLREV